MREKLGWFDSPTLASRIAYVSLLAWIVWTTTYLFPRADVVAAVALGAMMVDSVVRGRMPPRGGVIGGWLVALLASLVLTTTSSIWLGRSVAEVLEFVKWILLFFLTIYSLTSLRRVGVAVGLTILCLSLFPALGSLRAFAAGAVKVVGRADWQGFFGNPNALSASLALYLPLAVVFWRRSEGVVRRALWGGSVLIMLAAIFRSGSRSGLLAVIVVLVWVVWSSRNRLRTVVIAALGVSLLLATAPQDMKSRLATIAYRATGQSIPSTQEEAVGSTESRLEIWITGLQVFFDHPISGTGPGTFEEAHTQYQARKFRGWTGSRARRDAHNAFVRMAAETGIVGLLPFIALFVATFRKGTLEVRRIRSGRAGDSQVAQLLMAALAGLGAFLVSNLFNTFLNLWLLYMMFALIAVLIQISDKSYPAVHVRPDRLQQRVRKPTVRGTGLPGDTRAWRLYR